MSTNSRSRSRSPHSRRTKESTKNGDNSPETNPATENSEKYVALNFSNIPKIWNYFNVKDFVKLKTEPKNLSGKIQFIKIIKESRDGPRTGKCIVIFGTHEDCKAAYEALIGVTHEGTKIVIEPNYDYEHKPKSEVKHNVIVHHDWTKHEAYGLNGSYLDSLRIRPPLVNKLFVKNIDSMVTEGKLREVFGHAGHVLCVTMLNIPAKEPDTIIARIEFDHPVEAVQAISMFHDQELYDRQMDVRMDYQRRNDSKRLPEGMKSFGPGLGSNGEAIRGIRNAVELQPFKQFITQEIEYIKKILHERKEQKSNNSDVGQKSSLNPITALNSILNPQSLQTLQSIQALLGQGSSNADLRAALNSTPQTQNPVFQAPAHAYQVPNPGFQNTAAPPPNSGFLNTAASPLTSGYQNTAASPMNSGFQNTAAPPLNSGFQNTAIPPPGVVYPTPQTVSQCVPGFWPVSTGYQSEAPKPVPPVAGQGSWTDGSESAYGGHYQHGVDHSSLSTPYREPEQTPASNEMLMFSNLPSSVTSQALLAKMREVGELKFAEITGQGRAIVRFVHNDDALRCIKLFDQSKVDGQMIGVKFL